MGGIVYSTEFGRMCPDCAKPVKACECKKKKDVQQSDGFVRLSLEKRKGQGVTLIRGVPLEGDALKVFAKALRVRCSSGGTVKEGVIEIQGDHREFVRMDLIQRGWKLK